MTNTIDTQPNTGWLALGFILGPPAGMLLFFSTFFSIHLFQFDSGLNDIPQGIIFCFILLMTYGLTTIYVVAGVLGLPITYWLHSSSALNLVTISTVALGLTTGTLVGFRLLDFSSLESFSIEFISIAKQTLFIIPFSLFASTVFYWVWTRNSFSQFGLKDLLLLVSIVSAALAVSSVLRTAVEPRMVANVVHPNGARLLVTQKCDTDIPFKTEVFYDPGDGVWRWYYFDHEDTYWGKAEYAITGSEIKISSSDKRSISLNTSTGQCTTCQLDGRKWTKAKSTRTDRQPPVPIDQ